MADKAKQEVKVEGTILTMKYPSIGKEVTIDVSLLDDSIRARLEMHGMKQIAVDCGAGKTAAEAHAQLSKRLEAFRAGSWNAEREVDNTPTVIEAVLRAFKGKWTREQLEQAAAHDEAQVSGWRSNAKVKHELAKMREEKLKKAAKESDEEIEVNL